MCLLLEKKNRYGYKVRGDFSQVPGVFSLESLGERIHIRFYVQQDGQASDSAPMQLSHEAVVESPDFGGAGVNLFRGKTGLDACAVKEGIVVVWSQDLPRDREKGAIRAQLFGYDGKPRGPIQVVGKRPSKPGFGLPLFPTVAPAVNDGQIILTWNQPHSPKDPTFTVRFTPSTNILSKIINISSLVKPPPPVCADHSASGSEDTVLVILHEELRAAVSGNNNETFEIVALKVDDENSDLAVAAGGNKVARAGSVAQLDGRTAAFVLTPPPNAFGKIVLEYEAKDEEGQSCKGRVVVSVAAVNDSPEGATDVYDVDTKGFPIDGLLGVFNTLEVPAERLLGNDADIDGQTLSVLSVTSKRRLVFGQLLVKQAGSALFSNATAEQRQVLAFRYIPTTDFKIGQEYYIGEDVLLYELEDEGGERGSAQIVVRVRVPLTQCRAGETFEAAEATTTSDRKCRACSKCPFVKNALCAGSKCIDAGSFESQSCSPTRDRACKPLTVCDLKTQFESSPPGTTRAAPTAAPVAAPSPTTTESDVPGTPTNGERLVSDRVCAPLATCTGPGKFTFKEATGRQNRVCQTCEPGRFRSAGSPAGAGCAPHTDCNPGQEESQPPTFSSDRICRPCALGTFSAGKNQTCTPVQPCPAGAEEQQPATASADRVCSACGPTTYQDLPAQLVCKPTTECGAGREQATAATALADRTCRPCDLLRTFQPIAGGTHPCLPLQVCGTGQETNETGSRSADRTCQLCRLGTFQDKVGQPLCQPTTTCAAGTAEVAAPSPVSNRVCKTCAPGFYQDLPAQLGCKPTTECGAGKEVSVAQTPASDLVCRACAPFTFQSKDAGTNKCLPAKECVPGEQELVAESTPSSDTVCRQCLDARFKNQLGAIDCDGNTVCQVGTEEDAEPTDSSDRICRSCPSGKFKSVVGQLPCSTITTCARGEEQDAPPTPSSDRTCTACSPGRFQDRAAELACKPTTPCPAGTEELRPPTASADRVCAPCGPGSYQDEVGRATCKAALQCGPGKEEDTALTLVADRRCRPCRNTTFQSNPVGTHACIPLARCTPGNEEVTPATAVSDRTCGTCRPGTFKASAGQSPCVAANVCQPGFEQLTPPSASSDRVCQACAVGVGYQPLASADAVCRPLATCARGQEEAVAPTASSDRRCRPCEKGPVRPVRAACL